MALRDLAEVYETDILVVGGGLAGSFAAIKARQNGAQRVALVDKSVPGKSGCSTFAAGVIAAHFPHQDSLQQWMEELCELGGYLNDQAWLEIVLTDVFGYVEEMAGWGVNFLRKPDGDYERIVGRGGGPGRGLRNIMFHGPQLMEPVVKQLRLLGVTRYDRTMVTDLLVKDGRVLGVGGFNVLDGGYRIIKSRATILSAGGTYSKGSFVSHKNLSGDAHAMCVRAGVELMNFDFTSRNQSCTEFDTEGMNMFVALGGRFVNARGEEFMPEYDPVLGNRTTKPVMAAATALEVKAGRGPIYMDMTHFTPDKVQKLRQVLPLASLILQRAGVMVGDRINRKLAWGPAGVGTVAFGGGARITTRCETSMPGLYAAGDSAARHGAGHNEMGAGALTWAIVSGARAGRCAAEDYSQFDLEDADVAFVEERREAVLKPLRRKTGMEPDQTILAIQEAVHPWNVLELRHEKRLQRALDRILEIKELHLPRLCAYDPHYLILAHEAESLAITMELILRAGLERKESRCNLREDYPEIDNINWLKWIILRPEGNSFAIRTMDIPEGPVKFKRVKRLHPLFTAAGLTEVGAR